MIRIHYILLPNRTSFKAQAAANGANELRILSAAKIEIAKKPGKNSVVFEALH